ncbi:MAG: ABC transporter substrate-binding protein [Candidatus Dormibacteria bacterium]
MNWRHDDSLGSTKLATLLLARGMRATISTIAVVGLVAVSACGSSNTHHTVSSTLSVRLIGDYDSLNPATATSYSTEVIDNFLYDRLTSVDSNGKVHPYLATSWTTSPTSTTFHLRSNATCSDGTKVTPTVVKASLDYLLDPKTISPYASFIFGPDGAVPGGATVTADDAASTLTITLAHPFSDLLSGLAQAAAGVICPAGLANPTALKTQVFGSGPYTLTASVRGSSYTLTRRSDYAWGKDGATSSSLVPTVVLKVVTNDSTAANLIVSGGLNIAQISGPDVDRLQANSSYTHVPSALYAADPLVMNESAGLPGANPLIRKAVMFAINASDLNKAETFGHAPLVKTELTPNQRCYNAADGSAQIGFDMTQAASLLQQAGYTRSSNGPLTKNGKSLTLRVVGSQTQNQGPEYIRSQLASLGINATLSVVDEGTFVNIMYGTSQFDVILQPLAFTYPSPWEMAAQVMPPTPPNGVDVPFIANAQADALFAQAGNATEGADCTFYQQGEMVLMQNGDLKPINEHHYDWFGNGAKFEIDLGTLVDPFTLKATA